MKNDFLSSLWPYVLILAVGLILLYGFCTRTERPPRTSPPPS